MTSTESSSSLWPDKASRLDEICAAWKDCQACGLHRHRKQIVFGQGNENARILIVGEAPGNTENRVGVPFYGEAGRLLFLILAEASPRTDVQAAQEAYRQALKQRDREGVERITFEIRRLVLQDVFLTNAVMCLPVNENENPTRNGPKTREPDRHEIKACRPRLQETIYTIDPAVIIATGGSALHAVSGTRQSIKKARGVFQDILIPGRARSVSYLCMPTYHPSYLLRVSDFNVQGGEAHKTYKDIALAYERALGGSR